MINNVALHPIRIGSFCSGVGGLDLGVTLALRRSRVGREFQHSTPKPVELFRRPILKHLNENEIAYEPFAGTGPQFIAAELTGRRCFGLEIEPAYCDVIVARWEHIAGKKAVLADVAEKVPTGDAMHSGSGQPHGSQSFAREAECQAE